jgi:hypothetical protein
MNLTEEVYNFFNEGRPRTVNAGVDDIKKGPVGQGRSKGDRPRPFNAKKKLKTIELPQNGPSKFEEGAVHEILFIPEKPKVVNPRKSPEEKKGKTDYEINRSAQEAVYYTIYRKLTESEYKKIRNSIYTNTIHPSDKPEHFKDLYYIKFPLPLYGTRVHSATDLEVSIDLVPLSDIYEKGIGIRNLNSRELNIYVTEKPKIRYPFSLEDISFKYASNLTKERADNVENYVSSFKPNEKVEKIDRKKAKEILQTPEKMAAIAASGIFSYGGRLDGNNLLNRIVGSHNDVMMSSLKDTYDYYQPKRVDARGDKLEAKTIELKETDPIIQNFLKDRRDKKLPPLELEKEYPVENKKGHTITLTNNDKTKVREKRGTDITNFLSLVDEYIDTFTEEKEKNIVRKALIEDPDNLLKRRLDNDTLYNIIKARYDGKKSTVVPASTKTEPEIKKDKVEPKTKKDNKKAPTKPETEKETIKDVKTEAEGFFKDSKHNETFRKLIEAFSATIEKDENGDFKFDKIQRQDQYNKLSKYIPQLIEQIFKYTDQLPVRDYIVKNIINDRIDVLTGKDGKESSEIKTLINNNYETMKNKKIQEITISEAKVEQTKKYSVEVLNNSPADKLYLSKNVSKVFARQKIKIDPSDPKSLVTNSYIRSLSADQVRALKKSKDVISVEELPKDVKGFIKPSSNFRDKEKGNVIRFDPKNPKDVQNLIGKVNPGEKLYNVNIKIGDAKSQDTMMPLSQIEKMVPNYKLEKGLKQPYERKMFRAKSKDTGENIYDNVKGVLSFNSTEPIDTTKDTKKSDTPSNIPPPAQFGTKARGGDINLAYSYYLVDMSQPDKYPNGIMYRDASGGFVGGNDRTVEKEKAAKIGKDIKVYQKAEIKAKKVEFEDKKDIKTPEKQQYNYYLTRDGKVSKDTEGKFIGADSKEELESIMNSLRVYKRNDPSGSYTLLKDKPYFKDLKILDKEAVKAMLSKGKNPGVPGNKFGDYVKNWGEQLAEQLEKEDKKNIAVGSAISFTIQDMVTRKGTTAKQYNLTDNITKASISKNKKKLVIETTTGKLEFDKEGTATFTPSEDIIDKQETIGNAGVAQNVLNPPAKLINLAKKVLGKSKEAPKEEPAAEEPAKEEKPETQLESYIRKRIRQAIKEAEVSQYWGYQGADVKKKRLEDYLKRYQWGFQYSKNPYTHAVGSAMHAIVSKLVHELQPMDVDAVAMFNSYAPDGYQVSDLNQLDYASDSPLGSQLTQPYNPDSLTARGGRVAEDDHIRMPSAIASKTNAEKNVEKIEKLVKDMSPQLKDAILKKGNAKNAEGLINTFKSLKDIDKDFDKDLIYNMIKNSNK